MSVLENMIKTLAENAANSQDSTDAVKFSQAACNLANTACAAASIGIWFKEPETEPEEKK